MNATCIANMKRVLSLRVSTRTAFTLLEVMVSLGLGVSLLALAIFAQNNMSEVSARTSALAGIYSQASVIMSKLEDDFSKVHPAVAVRIDRQADAQACIFMRSLPMGGNSKPGNWAGSVDRRFHLLTWVSWDFSPEFGLRRGASPKEKLVGYFDANGEDVEEGRTIYFRDSGTSNQTQLNETAVLGRAAIAVREMKYFDNKGDAENVTVPRSDAQLFAYFWLDSAMGQKYNDLMAANYPFYTRGNTGVLRNDGVTKDYAAQLPAPNDGWKFKVDLNNDDVYDDADANDVLDVAYDYKRENFNKDKILLLGVEGEPDNHDYPSQMDRVMDSVELFEMQWIDNAGNEIQAAVGTTDIEGVHLDANLYRPKAGGYSSVDQRTDLSDAERNGIEGLIDGERQDVLDARPNKVRITFVMHNAPEDSNAAVIDPDSEPGSMNLIRSEFYNTSNVPLVDRSHELMKRYIESHGFVAVVITQVIDVP